MAKRILKRKYEQKLLKRAVGVKKNREFLLARLKREWGEVERAVEKDKLRRKLYETVRETGKVVGLTLLGMAAVCGMLVVGAVAPKIFSVFDRSGRHRRYFSRDNFRDRVRYLQRRGYIHVTEDDTDIMEIKLTDLGEEQVVKRALGDLRIVPQVQWDGRWRIIIFDIPERNKWAREGIRECLKRMGFYRLQKSIFVFPYPCRDEIEFLGRLYDVQGDIRFIETDSISSDDDLRSFFSLTS